MSTDLFPNSKTGVVYGLFASDEPLQLRYIGRTNNPTQRLKTHRDLQTRAALWIDEVEERGAKVDMRILGEYSHKVLQDCEDKWICFWGAYCDLLNNAPFKYPQDAREARNRRVKRANELLNFRLEEIDRLLKAIRPR